MSYREKPILKLYKYENNSFVMQAQIDDYQECSFEDNLYEAGQFSISINFNIPNSQLFQRGLFIQFGNSWKFGEITKIQDQIGEEGKGSQFRIITGFDARYILKRRVIKNMNSNGLWVMTGKGEIVLRNLINDQAGTNAENKRKLPIVNTIPSSSNAVGKEYSASEQFSNLYEVCKIIATQSEMGWRLEFNGNSLNLVCFEGTDRTQTVQFSTSFDSLANGEFVDSSESFANAIYVGGKGQNDDRDIYEGESAIEGDSPAGLDRFESWDNQSSMTTESEYETEALSMLNQYGQTLTMSGNGLAKCPYEYEKEYFVGDKIKIAFSGKFANAQILSVTEHWAFGAYEINFSFGKPLPGLDAQLQLILKQIQRASNKTNSTDSVRWYTIPTDTQMPSADVTYNTIGFVGDVGNGATFKLYLDNEKTGAKTYHVWFKQLAGNGKLTLTTGKSGAVDLSFGGGTYVAIISVDENGNIVDVASTPTNIIATGNSQPATSDGVAQAISSATANPNVSNATGVLGIAHGGTGQTSLDDVTVGTSKKIASTNITIKTGSTAQSKISLQTLMTWLMNSDRNYIPSGVDCYKLITTTWSYSGNDILQLTISGVNYELQLAGVMIEFMGKATTFNAGVFRLRIHSAPTTSFTSTSGYTKFPTSHIAEYTCNGTDYSPTWKMLIDVGDIVKDTYNAYSLDKHVTCSTAANTSAKTVNLPGFSLIKGARLIVYLNSANTAASALTLNVNGTGAKTIRWNGTVTSASTYAMTAGYYNCYYDGTYWNMDSTYEARSARIASSADLATQADYTRGNAYCTTASATQAKVANMRGYVLAKGAFPITFTNANTYNGKITLNVNSRGAKDVWINGAVSSSTNKTLPAGTYLCFYDGTKYMISTESPIQCDKTPTADSLLPITSDAVANLTHLHVEGIPTNANEAQTWMRNRIYFNAQLVNPNIISNYPNMADWSSAGGDAYVTLVSILSDSELNRISQFCTVNYYNGNWVFRTFARHMVDLTWFGWSQIF